MTTDDTFRDWLIRRIAHVDDLAAGSGGTMEQRIQLRELAGVLRCYDAEKAAAATDDVGTANHADTADTPRTDDPDDQTAYETAMQEYLITVEDIILDELTHDEFVIDAFAATRAIAALPKPVKGGER